LQQQSALVELFVVNILLPLKQYSEARVLLFSMQSTLSPQTIAVRHTNCTLLLRLCSC
jgi:hypothetical protein